jgi:hypothetical protein
VATVRESAAPGPGGGPRAADGDPVDRGRRAQGWLIAAAAVAGVASVLLLSGTSDGLIGGPDSSAYAGAAENIAAGKGITLPFGQPFAGVSPTRAPSVLGRAPLAQYFPGYPLLLSLPVAMGASPEAAARVVNALACGATAALTAWLVLRLTRGSLLGAAVAVALLLTTRMFVFQGTVLGSDALFVPLCLGAVCVLGRYLVAPRAGTAVAFVALAGAASLTRFLGVALAVVALVEVAGWPSRARATDRWRRALVLAAGAAAPGVAWQLWKVATDATGGAGGLGYHPPPRTVPTVVDIAGSWVNGRIFLFAERAAVIDAPTLLVLAGTVGLLVASWWTTRRGRPWTEPLARALAMTAVLFSVVYAVLLWVTVTFFVHALTFSSARMWLPVLPMVLALAVAGVWRLATAARAAGTTPLRLAALGILAVALPTFVWHASSMRSAYRFAESISAGSRPPPQTPVYRAVRRLPAGAVVFSNSAADVWESTGLPAMSLPRRRSPWHDEPNPDFERQTSALADVLCRERGGVVLYRARSGTATPTLAELQAAHLEVTAADPGMLLLTVDRSRCR